MQPSRLACGALITGAVLVALSGCGSSNNTSSAPATSATTSAAATSAAANSGSAFCQQASATVSQLAHIGAGLASTTPGATPSVTSFQQLFATATSAVDSLDSAAPSAIATAFHSLRSAYDQAGTQVRAATTFQQISAALSALGTGAVSSAGTQITAYLQTSCGITSPSP